MFVECLEGAHESQLFEMQRLEASYHTQLESPEGLLQVQLDSSGSDQECSLGLSAMLSSRLTSQASFFMRLPLATPGIHLSYLVFSLALLLLLLSRFSHVQLCVTP